MADNLTTQTTVSTVPSGSVIATDDVAGTHYQKVKLVDGTADSSAAIAGDAANGLDVDVTRVQGTVAVTQSGTWDEVGINDSGNSITVDGTVTASNAAGDVAHDTVDSGNPVKIGGKADWATRTPVADGDRVNALFGVYGQQMVSAGLDAGGGLVRLMNENASGGSLDTTPKGSALHDAADTDGPLKIGGYASATAPTDVGANGRRVNSWFLRNGAQATALTAAGALIGGDATNGLDVDVTRLPALAAGTNNIGDVDVLTLPALPAGTNNIGDVDVASIAAGDNNIGNVDIVTMPNVTLAAGTNTNEVVGDVAHDVAAAGNPLLNAGISQDMDDTAPPNQVAAESRATRIATDRDGAIFVRPFGPRIWSYHENSSSALTDTSVHAAPAAGLSLYVTDIVVSTGAATAFNIFFEEGASTVLGPYYLEAVAGRGMALHFMTPKKITAATALTVTTSAAIAHSIDVTGFTAQG